MRSPVREGTFFLLPVQSGHYGVGLVTRAPRRGGILLGCFFGPRRNTPPSREWLESRNTPHVVLAARFRDQALFRGDWKTLHVMETFDRHAWPIPAFHRFDGSITATPGATTITDWRIQYGDDNLIMPIDERPAIGADLRLREDTVYDPASLCREVGAWLTAAVPSADDNLWR